MKVKRAIEIRKGIEEIDNLIEELVDDLKNDYESNILTDEVLSVYSDQWASHLIDKIHLESEYDELYLSRSEAEKVKEYFREEV